MKISFWRCLAIGMSLAAAPALPQTIFVEQDKVLLTGGTVKMLDGLATLIVQPNTFPDKRIIVAATNPLVPAPPEFVLASAASIGLPGLAFGKPVTLQMSYEGLSLPSGAVEADLRVFRMWNHRWSVLPSTVDTVNFFVQTTISVGGTYAILAKAAGNPGPENLITYRCSNQDVSTSWRRIAPQASVASGIAAFFEELSRDADSRRDSHLTPTENGILFTWRGISGSDFYLAAIDGTNATRFTNLAFQDTTGASMNPTSTLMAFTAQIGGIWRLYKIAADGTPPVALATLPVTPTAAPSLNPNGNSVCVGTAGGAIHVYDMTSGAQVAVLGSGGTGDILESTYSPNGLKIGFLAGIPAANTGVGEIGSVTVGTGVVQRYTNGLGRVLAWDPNSAKLAYGEREIFIWTVGSGTRTLAMLTNGPLQTLLWR